MDNGLYDASEIILNNTNNALKRRLTELALQTDKKEKLKDFSQFMKKKEVKLKMT